MTSTTTGPTASASIPTSSVGHTEAAFRDKTPTTGLNCVWALEKKSRLGQPKPVLLRLGKKHQEYTVADLQAGQYALILHTTDRLPLGKRFRYCSFDICPQFNFHSSLPSWLVGTSQPTSSCDPFRATLFTATCTKYTRVSQRSHSR